jgi:hypothetical protein
VSSSRPAWRFLKDSIAKYETVLQDGRNPADRPRDGPQKYSSRRTSSRVRTLHLAEAVAAIGSIQDAGDTSCHRARTIEPQNSIALRPTPTPRPPRLTAQTGTSIQFRRRECAESLGGRTTALLQRCPNCGVRRKEEKRFAAHRTYGMPPKERRDGSHDSGRVVGNSSFTGLGKGCP